MLLHESLDTMKRSCTRNHQKSHSKHRQPNQMSVHRVTDSYLIKGCVNFILQSPNKDELTQKLRKYQDKSTEVDERTAELYSEQGNAHITELIAIPSKEFAKNTMQKGTCGVNFWNSQQKDIDGERNNCAYDDSHERFAMVNQDKRSDKPDEMHHFRNALKRISNVVQADGIKTPTTVRASKQKRTYETMASGPRKNHKITPQHKLALFGNP